MCKWIIALCLFGLVGCGTTRAENQNRSDLLLQLGITQIGNNNYPGALRNFLEAEKLNPQNAAIQSNLGLVYFLRQKNELSIKHFKRAIELEPTYTEAKNNLARVYIEDSQYQEAEQLLKQVLADLTFPDQNKAYINLGLSYFNQKKYAKARNTFATVINKSPSNCVAQTYYGRTYFEEGDYGQAAQALDRAIGFCQAELVDEPHYYSALAYYRLGDRSKSMARFNEIRKYYPNGLFREKAEDMLNLIRKGH